MENISEIDYYDRVIKIRNILKEVKQLSWDINKLENEFGEDDIKKIGYEKFIKVYLQFYDRIEEVARDFKNLVEKDEVVKRLKNKEE